MTTVAGDVQGLLTEAGFPHLLSFENRFQAMTSLCLHAVFLSRKAELDQFMSGLGPLVNVIHEHPTIAEPLLVAGHGKPPTADDLLSLITYENVDDEHKEFFKQYISTEGQYIALVSVIKQFILPPIYLTIHVPHNSVDKKLTAALTEKL